MRPHTLNPVVWGPCHLTPYFEQLGLETLIDYNVLHSFVNHINIQKKIKRKAQGDGNRLCTEQNSDACKTYEEHVCTNERQH